MKTFTISIPKPCHEDWSKMTPDEKGAFCGSCQKSVYDFSNKTDEEIINVFEKKGKEKVCGRFAPAQLSRPVVSFGNTNSTSRLVKFAYALLLVFGTALFNGVEAFSQTVKGDVKVEKMMGKVAVKPVKPTPPTNRETRMLGEVAIKPIKKAEKETSNPIKANTNCGPKTIIDDKTMVVGQTIMWKEPVKVSMGDTTFVIDEETDTTEYIPAVEIIEEIQKGKELIEPVTVDPIIMVAGGVHFIEIPNIPEEVFVAEEEEETKSTIVPELVIVPSEIEVTVSPNPSTGEIKLSYNLETATPVRIDLFDITGKRVRILTQQGNQYPGKYNISYNIADLPNGIYLATLQSGENKSSARIILAK